MVLERHHILLLSHHTFESTIISNCFNFKPPPLCSKLLSCSRNSHDTPCMYNRRHTPFQTATTTLVETTIQSVYCLKFNIEIIARGSISMVVVSSRFGKAWVRNSRLSVDSHRARNKHPSLTKNSLRNRNHNHPGRAIRLLQ